MSAVLFFDLANTLMDKPGLIPGIQLALNENGYEVSRELIENRHKLCSEIIKFPNKTSREFYTEFNAELLYVLGIIPTEKLVGDIFDRCTYLPWKAFDDVVALNLLDADFGIISNWDKSIREKLTELVKVEFKYILGSELVGIAKPDKRIFEHARQTSGLNYQDMLFVGDSIKLDVQPALDLGIRAILIDRQNIYPAYSGEKIGSLHELGGLL